MTDERNDLPNPSANNYDQRVRETLMTYMGRQGNPLDRGLTMRDMLDAGLIALKDGAKLTTGMSKLPIKSGPNITADTLPDLTPPPTPEGFEVHAGFTQIMIEHDPATFTQGHGHLRTVVYGKVRAVGEAAPVFAHTVKVAEFGGSVFSMPSAPATTWHLWIKWETNDNVLSADPAGGTNGLVATTGQDISKLLEALTGEITASQLYGDLSARIDLVDGPTTLVGSVAARLRAESEAGAKALNDKATALQNAADQAQREFTLALGTEASTRIAAISAETKERGSALLAQATALGASITTVNTQRQTDADSFAKSVTTLTSSIGDAQGAISTEVSTRATNEGVINRAITAMGGRVGDAESWITSTTTQTIARDKVVNESLQATESSIKNPVTGLVATHSLLTNYYSTTLTANSYADTQVTNKAAELTNPQTGIIASAISSNQIYTQLQADSATKSQIDDFEVKINDPKTGMLSKATNSKTIYSKADADTAMTAAVQVLRAEFVPPGAGAISIADYTDKVIAKSDASGAAVNATTALKAELLVGAPGVPPLLISKADIERTYTTSATKTAAEAITATAVKTAFEDATTGLVATAINNKQIYSKTDANSAMTTEINSVFTKFVDPATNSVSTTKMETELFTSDTAKEEIVNEIKKIGADFVDASGKMSTAKVGNAILTSADAKEAIANEIKSYKATVGGKTFSEIEIQANTAASDASALKSQYTVKLNTVGTNGVLAIAGFGLASEPTAAGDTTSQFLVAADRFAVVSTDEGVPYVPFIVQTANGFAADGTALKRGVHIADAFIQNGTIKNAMIGKAVIDDAHIASLDATKLTAGDGIIGDRLKSQNNNDANTQGWRIEPNGSATFNGVVVRGTVEASDGNIGGVIIEKEMVRTNSLNPAPQVTVEDQSKARPVKSMATTGSATPSTILLLDSGEVMGYGYSASGLFGARYQGASETMTPTLLKSAGSSPFITNVSAVDAGEKFFAFLKRDGTVWITGGDITGSREMSPCQLTGFTDVVSISASQNFLAMLTASGQVFVRGTAIRVICYDNDLPEEAQNYNDPLNLHDTVAGLLGVRVVKIAAGGDHLVLLDSNGLVWAAGGTHMGQCGPATKDGVGMSALRLDGVGIADAVRATDIWTGDLCTMFQAKVNQGSAIVAGNVYSFGQPIPCPAISMDCTYYTADGYAVQTNATYSNEYANWLSPKPRDNIPSFSTIIRARGLLPTLVIAGDVGDTFRVAIGGGFAGLDVDYRRMIIKRVRPNGLVNSTCSGYEGFVLDLPSATTMNTYENRGNPAHSHLYGQHSTVIDGWGDTDIHIGPFFITYRSRVTGMLRTTCDPDLVKWSGVTDAVPPTSGSWGSRSSRVNTWAGFTIDIDDPDRPFSGTGFGLKSNGNFMLGNSTGNRLVFNGTKLTYRGSLDVKSSTDINTSRMEISDTCIKVYEGNQLRVVIGKLS